MLPNENRLEMKINRLKLLAPICFALFLGASQLLALPFNDDMFHDQYKTGEVMRSNPEGSIPVGAKGRVIGSKEEAETLVNPLKGSKVSEVRGQRLWETNCTPCHGAFKGDGFERVIPLTTGLPLGPDVSVAAYKERSDGYLFGTIHFGGLALMPRYGYKLSITEHWDLVNYIRMTQRERTQETSE